VVGVIAVGPGQGEAFKICVARDKCEVHWGKEIKEKASRARKAASGKTETPGKTQWQIDRERDEELQRKARDRWKEFAPKLKKAAFAALEKVPTSTPLPKGIYQKLLGVLRVPLNTKPDQLPHALLRKRVADVYANMHWEEPGMAGWATALGVDVKVLKGEVQTTGADAPKTVRKSKGTVKVKAVKKAATKVKGKPGPKPKGKPGPKPTKGKPGPKPKKGKPGPKPKAAKKVASKK
jgi:hypothetical protein